MAFKIGDNTVIDNNRALTAVGVTAATNLTVPSGNTASRPTGAVGKLYFDTDLGKLLVHNGTEWIIAGQSTVDLSVHGTKYLMPQRMGAPSGNNFPAYRITNYFTFNEVIQNVSWAQHETTNGSWDCFVKLKTMPYEVQLMSGGLHGGLAQWPQQLDNRVSQQSGIADIHNGLFQPHSTLSLDNTAVGLNTGGIHINGGLDTEIQSWLFDSKFPNQAFLMTSSVPNSGTVIYGGHGIYKYSDTQYVTFNNTFTGTNQHNGTTGSFGLINLRCYNPNNVLEGQDNTSTGANAVWNKQYTCSNTTYGNFRGMVYGVFKSAVAGNLTVMYVNSKGINDVSYADTGAPAVRGGAIRIFDINMTTGEVVPDATIKHIEFRPTLDNTTSGSSLIPSGQSFTVCECSTHVTMITWAHENGGGKPCAFWIWDKANRDLRCFYPEIYGDATFNNGSLSVPQNPNRLWMNHYKMNDKIYLATCSQGDAHASHEGVYIYETSATAATPYMQVYNNTNDNQAMNASPSQFQSFRPIFSKDTLTFQHDQGTTTGTELNWAGHNATIGHPQYTGYRDLEATTLTVNPETNKGLIQSTFGGVVSGSWSGSTPTYYLNPQKQADGTATWTDADGGVGNMNVGYGWEYNMKTRKFVGGVS